MTLTLSEKLLLLALHDEKGSVVFSASTALPYGLAGALLLDLYLCGRIDIDGKKIKVISDAMTESELLNEALSLIVDSTKQRDAKYWLNKIHLKVKDLQSRIASLLVEKRILEKQEHTFLWIIKFDRYPSQNDEPEDTLKSKLQDIVLRGRAAADEDIALLSLVNACDLVSEVFERSEVAEAKKRIKSLVEEQQVGQAIAQTVDEITTAIMVVIMASAATTTVAT